MKDAGDLLTASPAAVSLPSSGIFQFAAVPSPKLCRASLQLVWPSPHFAHLPPQPLILGQPVRAAGSLKALESARPTSVHPL